MGPLVGQNRKRCQEPFLDRKGRFGLIWGMGRAKRAADGGLVYHVLNRANARMRIFEDDEDHAAFEQVLEEAVERTQSRLLAYCALPNHWHLVIWPREDGALSRFTRWLTLTHTQRWHAHRHSTGSGHVCQGVEKGDVLLFSRATGWCSGLNTTWEAQGRWHAMFGQGRDDREATNADGGARE